MQYRKQNLIHNFLTAAAIDNAEAWEIISGEINELVLDKTARLKTMQSMASAGTVVPPDATDRELALLIFDFIHKNAANRGVFIGLISDRNNDPYVGSPRGEFDVLIPGAEANPLTAFENLMAEKDPAFTKDQLREMVLQDLANKQKMRGVKTSFMDKLKNAGPVKIAATVIIGSLVIYGICRMVNKN